MYREYSENHNSEAENFKVVEEGKVLEFVPKDPPAEHVVEHIKKEANSEEYSLAALGFADVEAAQAKRDELVAKKKEIVSLVSRGIRLLGFGSKARKVNRENSVKRLPEIQAEIQRIESSIRLAEISEKENNNVIPFQESKAKPGSHAESMQLLGYDSITAAQEACNKMVEGSDEYKKLNHRINLAKKTAHAEHTDFEDLDIEMIKKKAA